MPTWFYNRPPEKADPKQVDFQEAYFLGASRARQLLGVVAKDS